MQTPLPNHDAFLSLLQQARGAIAKVCWVYGRMPHDRDDLEQEIVARLWAAFGRYDSNRPFMTWMYRIALNVAIDYRRRQSRWGRVAVGLDEQTAPAANDEAEAALREVRELLDRLDEADRALLLLHLEGHTYREIGEILGISESNVGTRLNRLKRSLQASE